jgi:hypothetical protein
MSSWERSWRSTSGRHAREPISLVLALQGCASTKEDIFPSDMRPMSEIYDRHFAKLRMRGIEDAKVQLHGEHPPPPASITLARGNRVFACPRRSIGVDLSCDAIERAGNPEWRNVCPSCCWAC